MRRLLDEVRTGTTSPDDAVRALRRPPVRRPRVRPRRPPPPAAPGHGRGRVRTGQDPRAGRATSWPSCSPGPTSAPVLLTRADRAPGGRGPRAATRAAGWTGRIVVWRPAPPGAERIVLATAGTSDLPVADECATTLTALGLPPVRLTDVGVAGVHRLLDHRDVLVEADAVVVVAGMEGALASLVGGLTGAPVVAVPTSVGYGAALEGVTALLAMLASCAVGADRRRHRQRLRRGVRRRSARPEPRPSPRRDAERTGSTPTSPQHRRTAEVDRDEDRLVPLLLRHRRGHGARLAGRRRRRPRRGPPPARAPAGGRVVDRRRSRCSGAASPRPRCTCKAADTTVVRTAAHIQGLVAEARLPERVQERALRHVLGARRVRGTPAPAAAGPGPLPRGRRHRRDRRRGRHVRGARGARRRRRPLVRGHDRHRHGPQRPRDDPEPGAGGRRPAAGRAHPRHRRAGRADHAHGRGAARGARHRLGPHAGDAPGGERLRGRDPRDGRSTQRHPGGHRRGARRRAGRGAAGGAPGDERRRRHRRGARPHGRVPAAGRCARRVGHADRDEEGPAGAHGQRARRPLADRAGRRRAHRRDRHARRAGPDALALAVGADDRPRRRRRPAACG